MYRMLKALYTAIADTLFPPRCPLCRAYAGLPESAGWCLDCLRRAVHLREISLNDPQGRLDRVFAVCNYRDGVQKPLRALKYRQGLQYLPPLAFLLRQEMLLPELLPIDLVVPVPLHAVKLHKRGFNQTEKLFSPWAMAHALPWADVLRRARPTSPQYQLTLTQRRQNMRGAFCLTGGAVSLIKGKHILLVDDIFTTGATLEACASTLKKVGARRVIGLALASDA